MMAVRIIIDPVQPEPGTDNFWTHLIVVVDGEGKRVSFKEPYDLATVIAGLRALADIWEKDLDG